MDFYQIGVLLLFVVYCLYAAFHVNDYLAINTPSEIQEKAELKIIIGFILFFVSIIVVMAIKWFYK